MDFTHQNKSLFTFLKPGLSLDNPGFFFLVPVYNFLSFAPIFFHM